ncbi:MAG: acyltransferase [Pseudomonadales bacterium]|nr:acyltransferase [Pseudomonadales bacterium]
MKYRSDIDGLRAIAVMSVIAFHSGVGALSGGYVGVDVFFVISGYLITTLIYREIQEDRFTFRSFYKRRAARLLPALSLTLFIVLIFGFIFYNNKTFDNLGKELFFSSFGAANILFAQGVNYFAKDEAYQPLIHLWSLGVEEQFYIVWPIILLLAFRISNKLIIPVACVIFIVSLRFSVVAVEEGLTKGYFLLHYRAFELLIGAITALLLQRATVITLGNLTKRVLTYIGLVLVITPMFMLDEKSNFPGYNALWPCLGTALIIAFPNHGLITSVLSHRVFVFVGLISYPLYLFHQPIISFVHFLNVQFSAIEMFFVVTSVSVCTSWLTYKYIENPIRKMAHSPKRKKSFIALSGLCATIPFFAVIGLIIAKSGGLEARFKYLNPFALEISQAHSTTFHKNFERGFKVSSSEHSSALFVGDSVLQHYILPIKLAMDLDVDEIDTVTRGGCVLLKGVDFVDKFSDISCDDIRDKLYSSEKTYDYVVISQAWDSYGSSVLNFSPDAGGYEKWLPFLNATVEHFLRITDKIIIIGAHPSVDGTLNLQPSITTSKESFLSNLRGLKISNRNQLESSRQIFAIYESNERVLILEPYRIFCNEMCIITDNQWSYYSDSQHISSASTAFVKDRILELLQLKNLTNKVSGR